MLSVYNFLKVKLCYRTYWKHWLAFLAICFLVFACSSNEDSDSPCPNQPQLTTYEVSNIDYDIDTNLVSVTFSGEIQNIQLGVNCETFSITNQGFVYSGNIQPTISNFVVNVNGQTPSVNISNLYPETTYYVRTFVTNALGTFYGNEVSFTTPESSTELLWLDANGVTVKARDWAPVGTTGIINGITYTVVDRGLLESMLTWGEDVSTVCTSLITDMSWLFASHPDFNQDISSWDVSNVTDMSAMFRENTSFNQNIGVWDVSNVTGMNFMFKDSPFNQDISDWDVSNVLDMWAMFFGAEAFNQDIGGWDVSNVLSMHYMFAGNTSFNQDLINWDVENVVQCEYFCNGGVNWTLPKPNFTNCPDDTNCN